MTDVTICIPTFNGEEFLKDCLEACFNQKTKLSYEVFVVDSGSTDQTLDIISQFKRVKLHQIPNEEFSHGKTRQLAAQMSDSRFMVYLTQDAAPAHEFWLEQLLLPFKFGEHIAAVFGKQIPRPDCMPTTKRNIIKTFYDLGPSHLIMLQTDNPLNTLQATKDANTFFSDVNAAYRRDIIVNKVPFPPVDYAEDQAISRELLKHGFAKAYSPQAAVRHSHSYSISEYKLRIFDEFNGLIKSGVKVARPPLVKQLSSLLGNTIKDSLFVLGDTDYRVRYKPYWILASVGYNLSYAIGFHRATRKKLTDEQRQKYSLEAIKKTHSDL